MSEPEKNHAVQKTAAAHRTSPETPSGEVRVQAPPATLATAESETTTPNTNHQPATPPAMAEAPKPEPQDSVPPPQTEPPSQPAPEPPPVTQPTPVQEASATPETPAVPETELQKTETPVSQSAAEADDIATLHHVPLFEGLAENDLMLLREIMEVQRFAPGQAIIREGETGDDFYVTIHGHTRCVVLDAGGNEIVLAEDGPGGFYGELSMLTGEPRSARIVALDEVTTLMLDRDEFFHFLREHPAAAVNILVVLGKRLHRTDTLLRRSVSRNINEIAEEELTWGQKLAEVMAELSGRLSFLVFNVLFAVAWVIWNNPRFGGRDFDPYPFNLLALLFGIEALAFSILVLNTQSRQEAKDRISVEINHDVNKKSELEIGLILRRLDDIERSLQYSNNEQMRQLKDLAERSKED